MKKSLSLLFIFFLANFNTNYFSQKYIAIDNKLESIKIKKYESVQQLHNNIVLPSYSDGEKVYAIAKFIVNNIAYGKRAKTPLKCVNSMEGVCQDYSELFKALCDISNIECHVVVGNGKNDSQDIGFYSSNHAWNIVRVNGKYQLYDLTWAAGTYNFQTKSFNKKFNDQYFNAKAEDFISNHFPDNSKWQLLDKPHSKNEYINSPAFSPEFKNLSLKNGIVRNNKLDITFESDSDFGSCSLFKWEINGYGTAGGQEITLTKKGKQYQLKIFEEKPGAYRYELVFWPSGKEEIQITNGYNSEFTSYSSSSTSSIQFKLITPNYKVPKPKSYDKKDPWGLIESYHYIFYQLDTKFFNELNPLNNINSINNIKYAVSLHYSLKNWIGDYKNLYTNLKNGDISYNINNFNVILSQSSDGYEFKEIKRNLIKKGSFGYGVKELQKYFKIEETGYFDDTLEKKIKNFQILNNLKADGIVGSKTYKLLNL